MKCGHCGKKMRTTRGNTIINMNGCDIRVDNIPVFTCGHCENRFIHAVIIERAQNYIQQYGAQDNQMDFGACERKENEDATVVMSTLWTM